MLIRDIIPPQKRKIKKETLKPKKLLAGFTILILVSQLIGIGYLLYPSVKPAKAAGTTYYVDNTITDTHTASATPDCTNYNITTYTCSGGSASAFATIADINAFSTLQPGDSVLFRKGQTWREQLTVPSSGSAGNPITFGAYGSGAKPIISGADVITGWTQATGDLTGAVTQANMRLSTTTGVAFVDFSSAGALTNYLGYQLVITDSTSKTITGYIKAAGTGETYGSPQGANPGMEGSYTAGVAPNNNLVRGTASEYTAAPHGGISAQQINNPAVIRVIFIKVRFLKLEANCFKQVSG